MNIHKRMPNHKLDGLIANLMPFTNYNGSIFASRFERDGRTVYSITHWRTVVLEVDVDSMDITHLEHGFISQTTSTLIGRIVRNLPRIKVAEYIQSIGNRYGDDARRLMRMVNR